MILPQQPPLHLPTPTPPAVVIIQVWSSGKRTGLEEFGHSSLAVAMAMDWHTWGEWQSRKRVQLMGRGRGPQKTASSLEPGECSTTGPKGSLKRVVKVKCFTRACSQSQTVALVLAKTSTFATETNICSPPTGQSQVWSTASSGLPIPGGASLPLRPLGLLVEEPH